MTRDADPASSRPLQGDAALLRAVGSLALAAAVINIIVGGGIFKMPAALSSQVGAAAPLALLAGAAVMVPVALCFAAMLVGVHVLASAWKSSELPFCALQSSSKPPTASTLPEGRSTDSCPPRQNDREPVGTHGEAYACWMQRVHASSETSAASRLVFMLG